MPSPVGHALGAIAVGTLVERFAVRGPQFAVRGSRSSVRGSPVTRVALLGIIGIAPDLDLLIGRHSMETHSVGAAVLVGALAAWGRLPVASSRTGIFLAGCLAWLSHPLLDMLALDTSAPLGVMLLWPFSTSHMQTGWSVFAAISRRYWLDGWAAYTALAIARELVILGPVVWLASRTGGAGRLKPSPPI